MPESVLVAGVAGFLGGIFAVSSGLLVVALFHYSRHAKAKVIATVKAKPSWYAGVRRTAKFLVFSVVGVVMANLTSAVITVLTRANIDPVAVTIAGQVAGSIVAGVHKTSTWKELTIEEGGVPATTQ